MSIWKAVEALAVGPEEYAKSHPAKENPYDLCKDCLAGIKPTVETDCEKKWCMDIKLALRKSNL